METAIKRKNIDLPIETLQKLSLMAITQGRSLKSYIESILIAKASSITIDVVENPSPSGDEWFLDEENLKTVDEGIAEMKHGKCRAYTIDDIKKIVGV